MSKEDGALSRRKLLAQLGAVGLTGLSVGAGTNALVSDLASYPGNAIQSRRLDLGVAYEASTGTHTPNQTSSLPSEFDDTDAVTVQFDDLERGSSAGVRMALEARPCERPVEMWMRVTGNGLGTDLASTLRMNVTLAHACGAGNRVSLLDPSVANDSVNAAVTGNDSWEGLQAGVPVRNDCSVSGDRTCRPPVCIDAVVQVPDETIPNRVRSQSLSLTFEFVARQCTGGRSSEVNPWNE
jgi:hypothetical protein